VNTTLILVRHGQTDSNLNHRYQGQTDVPMNNLGRAQIEAAAAHLKGVKPAAIYCSTLIRAHEAAAVFGRALGVEPVAIPELRERSFGQIEGLTREEAAQRFPESWEVWQTNRAAWVPPAGESLGEMWGRVLGVMERLWQRHAGQTFIYVGHGGPINAVLCNALGAAEEARRAIAIGNGSIAIVTRNEAGPTVLMVNETCHLADLPGDIEAD
jgi:broad specificity phosphatase PhoE